MVEDSAKPEAPAGGIGRAELAAAVEHLSGVPVLVLGDFMLDRFVYGSVERVSPEAPIPVLRISHETAMLGGAGNVLRNLIALGARPLGVGVVGEDAAGEEVAVLADRDLKAVDGRVSLIRQPGGATTIKDRFVAAGQQLLRVDRDPGDEAAGAAEQEVLQATLAALEEAAVVILSDYGKGLLSDNLIAAVVAAAGEKGCPVIVDPKGRDFVRYRGASWITPNRRELQEASSLPTATDGQVVVAAQRIISEAGIAAVLATRSEQGMTLTQDAAGDRVTHLPAEAREVFDVSGAGDTVVAVFAAALGAGLDAATAAQLSNVAAAIVVGKQGTAVARPSEILRALHASDLLAAEAKVSDLESLLDQVARWRRAGLIVGFTNGCFDLLHPGHVSLLEQARAACDRLIVGLNSDASVRRLKGETRPVQGEAARATVLASLASVSRVAIFAEDTPLALIDALRPDVLVKGADYSVDQIVGADIVQGYGGKVVLAELATGHSTTATIGRLARG